jgi:nitric oxide dioxygenase
VSNFLHEQLNEGDVVRLTPPAGSFTLNNESRPLVLLTGGVGLTPAMSMLSPALASGREVHFIHAAINGQQHAFKTDVEQLAASHDALKVSYCYEKPGVNDKPHFTGQINRSLLADLLPADRNCDVYLLGPKGFMQAGYAALKELAVPVDNIRYEFFGPLESLETAA